MKQHFFNKMEYIFLRKKKNANTLLIHDFMGSLYKIGDQYIKLKKNIY